MNNILIMFLVFVYTSSTAFAAFSPKLLKLSADTKIQYKFDGSELQIPITVSGTDATLYFMVHTKGIASTVPNMRNGYLGWHHVCKIDTCVYLSPKYQFSKGLNTVTWDGKDDDSGVVPSGEYTYYIWAFDSVNAKQKMSQILYTYGMRKVDFIEKDLNGNPLNNPIYHFTDEPNMRWEIGGDPLDVTLAETTELVLPEGYGVPTGAIQCIDPNDPDHFYVRVSSITAETQAILKYKFVPNGKAVMQMDFGEYGFGMLQDNMYLYEPSTVTDGLYLYGRQYQKASTDPDADLFIVNLDGLNEKNIDLRPWWTRPDEFALGKAINSGPDYFQSRNGKIALNCYCSCIKQLCDPVRYLESGEDEDLFLWSNLNGDYVLDQNFEETAVVRWACNYPVSAYPYTIDIDENFFAFCPAYDYGAVSLGLIGPDGTGIGFLSFQGETGGWKKGALFIDSGTPFDGIYCDNEQAGGTHYQEGGWQPNEDTAGIFFVGHDSINGIISNVVGVADNAPESIDVITLVQNAPNPFNPTTTINFSLARTGDTTVEVYNVAGQKIDTLVNEYMESGSHSAVWDASEFSAGVYFCIVENNNHSRTIKMTLVK